jgi:hypothetical protein
MIVGRARPAPPTVSRPRVPPSNQNAVTAAEAKASTAAATAGALREANRDQITGWTAVPGFDPRGVCM